MHSNNFLAQLNRAWMTQSITGILNELAMDNTYYTLCAQQAHSQPQENAPGRPCQATAPDCCFVRLLSRRRGQQSRNSIAITTEYRVYHQSE